MTTHWSRKLQAIGACADAVTWAKEQPSFTEAWAACERGDWMLWLAGKMRDKPDWPTRQQLVLAACDCAELSLKYVPKGEDRPLAPGASRGFSFATKVVLTYPAPVRHSGRHWRTK